MKCIGKKPALPAPIPVAILVRVSTAKQETDRQIFELQELAGKSGWHVVEVIQESVSGNAADSDRIGIERAVELARTGVIRKVLVHEVSRVARRNSTAHRFVEDLEGLGVSLYWHAQRIETLLSSGRRNPAASIMFSLLAEMARSERETLVERIMSGLAEARRKGHRLGRPPGSVIEPGDFLGKHRDVVRALRAGHSIRNTAKISGKGVSTVQRVKAVIDHSRNKFRILAEQSGYE